MEKVVAKEIVNQIFTDLLKTILKDLVNIRPSELILQNALTTLSVIS